jgi:hypothetical protein
MKDEWISVFAGDVWRVKIVQAELDGLGIETFVPDEYVPTQDPHLSGTPTSASELFVRPADVERVQAILAQHRAAPRADAAGESS